MPGGLTRISLWQAPVRKQYLEIKSRYPDALLLYRMGDFYETFDEDARLAARDLEIVLTQRDMGQGEVVPLAGIPYHALDSYLAKLVRKGHRVAIAEQTSEPGRQDAREQGRRPCPSRPAPSSSRGCWTPARTTTSPPWR